MALQRVAIPFRLCNGGPLRLLKLVMRCVQRRTDLSDLLQLEQSLNFLGPSPRLDQDEAHDFAPREHDLGMRGNFGQRGLDVIVGGNYLRLIWRRHFPCDRGRFSERRNEDTQFDKCGIGEFCLVDVGTHVR